MTDEPDAGTVTGLAGPTRGPIDPESAWLVADYIAARPELAEAALAEARTLEGLRLALAPADAAPPAALIAAARRLEGRLARRRHVRGAAPWALAVTMLAVGWTGHMIWDARGPAAHIPKASRTHLRSIPGAFAEFSDKNP